MKCLSLFFSLVFIPLLFSGCSNAQSSINRIDVNEFKVILDSTSLKQIIDIRTPQEFNSGHLNSAVNINFNHPSFKSKIAKLPKDVPVFLYCHSGGRSGRSLKSFKDENFMKVYELKGGISAWKQQGYNIKNE